MSIQQDAGSVNPGELEVHPAAGVFPLVEGAEFEALVEDIRTNGLQTPILLDAEGRVLDGRNRLRACRAAGVAPRFERWSGAGSPIDAIISLNVRRRHLNPSQRAMAAARLKELLAGDAALRKGARTDLEANLPRSQFGRSREKAAATWCVSERMVDHARRVLKSGDEALMRSVDRGKLAVSTAARRLEPPRPQQSAVEEPAGERVVLMLLMPRAELPGALRLIRRLGSRHRVQLVRMTQPGGRDAPQ